MTSDIPPIDPPDRLRRTLPWTSKLRLRVARWILPDGWYAARNRSSCRDDFAGDLVSALNRTAVPGYYLGTPTISSLPTSEDPDAD